ncbi:MAG: hypothetical protein L3J03_11670, partial [Desulfobacterales bacterium]|nr:hypothetical protein [Desulfobacterales bacterium]
SPPRRSEFLLDSLFMNSRSFSMERPLVEEDPFPDRRGLLNVYHKNKPWLDHNFWAAATTNNENLPGHRASSGTTSI